MSNIVTGQVEFISEKPAGPRGNLAYNVKMSDGEWYGHGFDKPNFEKGDTVTFSVSTNGRFKNIDKKSVEVHKGAPAQSAKQTYVKKEDNRQAVIVHQSARNAAIDYANVALTHGLIKVPADQKKKLDFVDAFVEEYTTQFHEAAMAVFEGRKPKHEVAEAPSTDDEDE